MKTHLQARISVNFKKVNATVVRTFQVAIQLDCSYLSCYEIRDKVVNRFRVRRRFAEVIDQRSLWEF